MNFIDLLLYEKNKVKIITFPSFTSSSLNLQVAQIFCDRNLSFEERKKNKLFSVIFEIHYNIDDNNIYSDIFYPICFDISDLSKIKEEEEVLFQPFSFFKIKKIEINLKDYTADIVLSAIKKLDILEYFIKEKYRLKYNKEYNIVEIPEKDINKYEFIEKYKQIKKNKKKNLIKKENEENLEQIIEEEKINLIKNKEDEEKKSEENFEQKKEEEKLNLIKNKENEENLEEEKINLIKNKEKEVKIEEKKKKKKN